MAGQAKGVTCVFYICNERSDNQIKKTVSFIIEPKYSGLNLTKEVKFVLCKQKIVDCPK